MTPDVALALSALFTIIVTLVLTALGWRVKQSQEMQIRALQSQLDVQVHAHKLTFDTEFRILSDLWFKLVDLREATISLRPKLDKALREDETYDDRKQKRLQTFSEKYEEYKNVVQKNKPFYPQSIHDAAFKVMRLAAGEADAYEIRDPDRRPLNADYWKQALEHRLAIITESETVCEAIRAWVFSSASYK